MHQQYLEEVEQLSLKINDPIDPKMDQIYYLYALINFKIIEDSDPFLNIDQQIREILDYIEIGLSISQRIDIQINLYSLLGDVYCLIDRFVLAEESYEQAIQLCQDNDQLFDLNVALIKIQLIELNDKKLIKLFSQLKQYCNSQQQINQYNNLYSDYQISIKETINNNIPIYSLQSNSKTQKSIIQLGIFGNGNTNFKRKLSEEILNTTKQIHLS